MPAPPVLTRFSWLQPPLRCTAFQDALSPPSRSLWPSMARLRVGVARPVVARGGLRRADERPAVRVGAGEHVVLVRRVADAVHRRTLLGERGRLADVVPIALDVTVQVGDVRRDQRPLALYHGPVPMRSRAFTRRLAAGRLRAQVRAPRAAAGAGRGRERLAVLVGAGQTAQVRAVPGPALVMKKPIGWGGGGWGGCCAVAGCSSRTPATAVAAVVAAARDRPRFQFICRSCQGRT